MLLGDYRPVELPTTGSDRRTFGEFPKMSRSKKVVSVLNLSIGAH
ncbi:MAG TPA: hypothetical protein VGK23_08790 [Methanomassiliicoccales archaeon]|jgi:hypothetical protein